MSLPFIPPLADSTLLAFLGDRAIPGVEEVVGSAYRRSIHAPTGPAVLSLTAAEDGVRLDATLEDPRSLPAVVCISRALFDLNVDPAAVARTLRRDPLLRPVLRAHQGIRVPGAADGFELVVRAILGQQVSVRAARTMLGRVAARFGTPLENSDPGVATLFPRPERLADAALEELGLTGRRAATIRRVASMVTAGDIDLSGDPDETAHALLEIGGIGPWTVEYVRMRALRDPDAFPAGDLGVRRTLERLGADPRPRAILDRAEAWRPWRAYATMLLWQHEG